MAKSKTKKVYVTRRHPKYAYADGQSYDMPEDQAEFFIEEGLGLEKVPKPEKPPKEIENDLPDDIPFRDELIKARFLRLDALQNHKSLGTIPGIVDPDKSEKENEKRVKKLRDYLDGKNTDSSTEYTVAEVKELVSIMSKQELADFIEGDDRKGVQALLD